MRSEQTKDILGQTFGRLKVIEYVGIDARGDAMWKSECECGGAAVVAGKHLRSGSTKSCGCLYKDRMKDRTEIAGKELKMTPEILTQIREFVMSNKMLKQKDQVEILIRKFPQFAQKSMPAYINGASVSDKVFKMYLEDKISFGILRILGTCDPISLADFLLDEVLERKMTTSQLETAKSLMRNKDAKSWDEAIKIAMKQYTPESLEPPKPKRTRYQVGPEGSTEAPRSFDELLNDIVIQGTNWRMKVQMAIDMAPFVSDPGQHHFTVFNKIYMLRHMLKENFEFVDHKVKEYLDKMLQMGNVAPVDGSDAAMTAKETEHETHRSGPPGGGSFEPERIIEGAGQIVPPASPDVVPG